MLALVQGSSTHAFETMLSAFILGIALGGLWIRGRIERYPSPLAALARVQILMGLAALATLPPIIWRSMPWRPRWHSCRATILATSDTTSSVT